MKADCKACTASVRLAAGEVERLLAEYLAVRPSQVVDDETYRRRMDLCGSCEALRYGTTCWHCGCLVAVRAKLAEKSCPAVLVRWGAVASDGGAA